MDKKLLGIILIAAAVYYMSRKDTMDATSSMRSELDVNDVPDGAFIESSMAYMSDSSIAGLG